MVRLIAVALKRAPRGESALPYLAAVLFVLLFVAWPLVDVGLLMRPLLGMVFLAISLTGLFVLGAPGRFVPVVLTLGGIVFALQTTMLVWPSDTVAILNEVAAELFALALCGVLLSRVMGPGRVTPNRIVGAVVVYLLFAVQFAFLYALIERLSSGAFVMGQEPSASSWTGWRFFYLSMITLSSLGLSDITPVHPFARSLVMLEALLGQLYTTVLLARLVSLEVAHRIRNAPPEMRLDNLDAEATAPRERC
jgi:uncharacterized membrane protein